MRQIYPESYKDNLYYIEFHRWSEQDPLRWQLFQRNFMYSPEEWEKLKLAMKDDFAASIMSNEVHPWNLGEGIVNEREDAIDLNTKKFLQFMVDALNEKVKNTDIATGFKKDVATYMKERDGY